MKQRMWFNRPGLGCAALTFVTLLAIASAWFGTSASWDMAAFDAARVIFIATFGTALRIIFTVSDS